MKIPAALTAVLLGPLLVLGACSKSSGSDTTAAPVTEAVATDAPSTETSAETTGAADSAASDSSAATDSSPSGMAASFATGFEESTGVKLTDAQSSCMTDSILSTFTGKELIDIGSTPGGFDALSDADKAKAMGSFQNCPGVLEEAFFAGFKKSMPEMDETQGRCGAAAIGKAFTPEELVQLSSDSTAFNDPEVMTKVFTAFGSCDNLLRDIMAAGVKSSGGLTDEQANCAADAMLKVLGPEGIVKISVSPETVDAAKQKEVADAIAPCQATS